MIYLGIRSWSHCLTMIPRGADARLVMRAKNQRTLSATAYELATSIGSLATTDAVWFELMKRGLAVPGKPESPRGDCVTHFNAGSEAHVIDIELAFISH